MKLLADPGGGRRLLLLGSAQILLLQQVRETLAGRAALLALCPLALVEGVEGNEAPPSGRENRIWRGRAEGHFVWRGYPTLEPMRPEDRRAWLRDFRRTYLERDLSDLGRVADVDRFALAQNLLAARTASIFTDSEAARELGVAVDTVKHYVCSLEISYQVLLLRPLLSSVIARLVESPKLYWTDLALARHLAEQAGAKNGAMFETAFVDKLLRWSSQQPAPPSLHFFRTHAGREVDVLLNAGGRLAAIEVKTAHQAHRTDARPLTEVLGTLAIHGLARTAWRLGRVVTRSRKPADLPPWRQS